MEENTEQGINSFGCVVSWAAIFMLTTTRLMDLEKNMGGITPTEFIVCVLLGAISSAWIVWRLAK